MPTEFDADFVRFHGEAQAMGLKGVEISNYIKTQRELEFKHAEQERDRAERLRERELVRKREELENDRKFELERLRVEADLGQAQATSSAVKVPRPVLPTYTEGEDIDLYLSRFERLAELLKIPKSEWPVRVGGLLSGKAVSIYTSLTVEIAKDYDRLKAALLNAFKKTYNTYRSEFKTSRVQPDQTFLQFSNKFYPFGAVV